MRVIIADDHALFRDGMVSLLQARGIEVVAEASNGSDAIAYARIYKPDIVLMDLRMPGLNGLDATRLLSAELPEVKVVVVTASEDDADLFEAIKSGAEGFISKNLESDRFFELLEGVTHGEPALTPGLARKLLREFAQPAQHSADQDFEPLTERETDVLDQLVQGVTTNRELAAQLNISENTVKYHLRNILYKLHLHNRAEVIAYAVRHGLVEPPEAHPNG